MCGDRQRIRMIVTVTLNLALDVTYRVPAVELHAANRVTAVAHRAGGKGVNVARVLKALGHETLVCGLAGGATGTSVSADLAAAGLDVALTEIGGETRRTLAVVDEARGDATGYWEPGPRVDGAEWERLLATYDEVLAGADAVVLSGSLPPGLPADAYAILCRRASDAGVPAVLDADGEPLRRGLAGSPALVKPNRDELERTTGASDPVAGAESLLAAGAGAVVVSQGADGLLAVTPDGRWRAAPPGHVEGNPTGAGDAAVAALTAGLVEGLPWPERLARAAAVSAAAVAAPVAGSFDRELFERLLTSVAPEEVPAARRVRSAARAAGSPGRGS
jgi:tagatose 6-phosphate kinase